MRDVPSIMMMAVRLHGATERAPAQSTYRNIKHGKRVYRRYLCFSIRSIIPLPERGNTAQKLGQAFIKEYAEG